MKPITYQARDGLTIHGYLTLPHGGGKNLPLIVNPHGGPWARDVWGYNPEVQFLANRGYAVLQMNFRGSTGYGRAFWEAGFKQWGKKMQDDVTDGVRYAIAQGIADPQARLHLRRQLWRLLRARRPRVHAGALRLRRRLRRRVEPVHVPEDHSALLEADARHVLRDGRQSGNRQGAARRRRRRSLHADNIRAPLLIAQGAQDPRVNIDESDQMVAALKKHGIAVEYLVKENEGHGFANEENRFEFYEAMERFLEKHLR